MEDFKGREELTYEQVKKSVEMVEQAQLEQTQVLVIAYGTGSDLYHAI